MAGLAVKALAGAGGAVKDASMEMLRAEIMQMRDARLNNYATQMETNVRQPFQTSEREASQANVAAEAQKGREFTGEQNKPKLAGELLDNTIKQITISNAKEVQSLRAQFQKETDPTKRAAINETIQVLTGKDSDKFLPVPLKDEMGNITGYQVLNTKTGAWIEPTGGKPPAGANGKADYSGLWGAGKKPAAEAGQQTQDESNFTAGFNKVRGILPSNNDSNAYMEALTGQPNAAGTIELHTAQNILANMKASNNFTVKSPYGGQVNKAAVIADLQKALPYAKGDQAAEIQQAIATLSGAAQQDQKDFTTGFNSVSGTPPGRK
jgi:hypothetical protein